MIALISNSRVRRLVPLLPGPDTFDFASVVLAASQRLSPFLLLCVEWETLVTAIRSNSHTATQREIWLKIESVIAREAAALSCPVLQTQLPTPPDGRPIILTTLQHMLHTEAWHLMSEARRYLKRHHPTIASTRPIPLPGGRSLFIPEG
jgi:hypothetical protein